MNQNAQKQAAAEAALSFIDAGTIVGVGTGSTANYFIDALATRKDDIRGAVASSEASAERLRQHGIEVFDLNDVDDIPVYEIKYLDAMLAQALCAGFCACHSTANKIGRAHV